jgi:hypothetical protein
LGERLLCKQEVIGSIPFTSTKRAVVEAASVLRTRHEDMKFAARGYGLGMWILLIEG